MINEISRFTQWASRHASKASDSLTGKELKDLEKDNPFFFRLISAQREILTKRYREKYFARIRRRIDGADRRWRNRRRKEYKSYYTYYPGIMRLGRELADNLTVSEADRRQNQLAGIQFASERDVLDSLSADVKAINEDLAAAGQPEITFTSYKGIPAARWKIHVKDYQHPDDLGKPVDASDRHMEPVDLGLYTVYLNHHGIIYVEGGIYESGRKIHPHVYDNSLCTGDFQNFQSLLKQSGALLVCFQTINRILNTYNPDSPYISLYDLVNTVLCARCEAKLRRDSALEVDGEYYCTTCVGTCNECYDHIIMGEDRYITCHTGELFCEECAAQSLARCTQCGQWHRHEEVRWWDESPDVKKPLCKRCSVVCQHCKKVIPAGRARTWQRAQYCPDCVVFCHMEPCGCTNKVFIGSAYKILLKGGGHAYFCDHCHHRLDQVGLAPTNEHICTCHEGEHHVCQSELQPAGSVCSGWGTLSAAPAAAGVEAAAG